MHALRASLLAVLLLLPVTPAGAALTVTGGVTVSGGVTVTLPVLVARYVRKAASGTGSGLDWTNACTDFSGSCDAATLIRGATYYVATGAYATRNFTTPESGTLPITIKGATAADHGTETGWSSAFGVDVTQATWAHAGDATWAVIIGTSYWVFDGSVGSGTTATAYGFRMLPPTNCNTAAQSLMVTGKVVETETQTSLTIRRVAFKSCGSSFDVGQFGLSIGCGQCYTTDSLFANNLFDGGSKALSITNLANSIIEHNISINHWSSGANHGGVITNTNCHNSDVSGCSTAFTQGFGNYQNTIRYNQIIGCRGTACIEALDPGNVVAINAYKIYGNVFVDDQTGNGTIATGSVAVTVIKDTLVYNNTFINCQNVIFRECGFATPCLSSSGNVFKNNLLYNSASVLDAGTGGGAFVNTHNTYWAPVDAGNTETNGQIVLGGACPMQNCSIVWGTGDYRLLLDSGTGAGQVNAGLALGAPYDLDLTGATRGTGGAWERGAYEF